MIQRESHEASTRKATDQQVANCAIVSRSSQESDENKKKNRSKKPDLASRPEA
jgi:hypothetical protein